MPEEISKHRLHFQMIEGSAENPYLVFLHEGLGCVAMWQGFPELLCRATGCPGLVYDRSGYGKSQPMTCRRTVHYMHDYALRELPDLLAAVIPGRRYILIGHSDGGSISLIYGAERPPLLTSIITEAAHVFVEPETVAGVRNADKAWRKGQLKGLSRYHGDKTEAMFKAWSETWLSEWFQHWNIEYLLPSITVPVLVIQGSDDQYGSAAQADAIVAGISGEARIEMVVGCGHAPHLEARQAVLECMTNFIAGLMPGSRGIKPVPGVN